MNKKQKILNVIKEKITRLCYSLLVVVLWGYFDQSIPKYTVFTIGFALFVVFDSICVALKNISNDEDHKDIHKKETQLPKYVKKGQNVLDKMDDDSVEDKEYAEKFLSSIQRNDKKISTESSLVNISDEITKEVTINDDDDEIYKNLGIKL